MPAGGFALPPVDEAVAAAFAVCAQGRSFATDWCTHLRHQVLHVPAGALYLEVADAVWLLPAHHAAWICAGVRHRLRAEGRVELCAVHLSPKLCRAPAEPCLVFALSKLGREMLLHALRWGPDRDPRDRTACRFFAALAALCEEWVQTPQWFRLPTARSQALQLAMDHALGHLGGSVSMADAARAAGLSERTLARRFAAETRITWREFLHAARMLRALELLTVPQTQVRQAATAVGFESLGAFTRAFVEFVGEKPRDYRRRATGRL